MSLKTVASSENGTCSICLNEMNAGKESIISGKESIIKVCQVHKFHRNCIQEWVDAGHNTCPNCRAVFKPGEVGLRAPVALANNRDFYKQIGAVALSACLFAGYLFAQAKMLGGDPEYVMRVLSHDPF